MRRVFLSIALLLCAGTLTAQQFNPTTKPTSPDGTAAIVDLPASQHMRNTGGNDNPPPFFPNPRHEPGKGSGLCVFTSLQHAAFWQNVRALDGFRDWMTRKEGGGYPQKVDQMFAQFCREKGASVPPYIQHTGGDESFLELALKTDRVPCVTYDGRDDFYRDRAGRPAQIAHMVNLAHLDTKSAAIIDNNRPGFWVWMSRADFLARWRGNSGGWAVVLLAAPPPPHPPVAEKSACSCKGHEPGKPWPDPNNCGSYLCPANGGKGGCDCGNTARACICGDSCKCKPGDCPAKCPVYDVIVLEPQPLPFPLHGWSLIVPRPGTQADLSQFGTGSPYPVFGQQCPNGRCPLVQPPSPSACPDGRCPLLPVSGGVYNAAEPPGEPPTPEHEWRQWDDGSGYGWRFKQPAVGAVKDYGVSPDKIHSHPEYSLCGSKITKSHAHALLADNGLADDSDHWHFSAVGDAAFCSKVVADVNALPVGVRSKLHVQTYAPDHWAVAVFSLPPGANLRKPSPGRIAGDVGTVAPSEYSATALAALLAKEGGPTYTPPPPAPPTPKVDPSPAPQPTPKQPDAPPAPAPVKPADPMFPLCCLGLLGLLAYLLRRGAPPPPTPA